MYIILFLIAFVGSMAVQGWLRNTYATWMKRANTSGLTGRDVAQAILQANGIGNVSVEAVKGVLSDHYDPRAKAVRLSEANYAQASVAGMAVAAHEVGHALQHARGYAPLQTRTALLPVAGIGSQFGPWIALAGLFFAGPGSPLVLIGLVLFGGAVLFHIVTLPIEFDASRRALVQLEQLGLVTAQDAGGARRVLTAAGMTYVAAAASSIAYFFYLLGMARD